MHQQQAQAQAQHTHSFSGGSISILHTTALTGVSPCFCTHHTSKSSALAVTLRTPASFASPLSSWPDSGQVGHRWAKVRRATRHTIGTTGNTVRRSDSGQVGHRWAKVRRATRHTIGTTGNTVRRSATDPPIDVVGTARAPCSLPCFSQIAGRRVAAGPPRKKGSLTGDFRRAQTS
jgi:hypothetical protein